jgi:hypothetical protein
VKRNAAEYHGDDRLELGRFNVSSKPVVTATVVDAGLRPTAQGVRRWIVDDRGVRRRNAEANRELVKDVREARVRALSRELRWRFRRMRRSKAGPRMETFSAA